MHRHYTTMVRNRMDLVNYGCLDLNGPRTRKVQGTSSMYKHSSTHWQVKRRGSLCTIKVGCVAGMKVGTPHHRTQQSEDICYLMGSEREKKEKKRKEKRFGKPRYLIFSHLPAYHEASFVATSYFYFLFIFLCSPRDRSNWLSAAGLVPGGQAGSRLKKLFFLGLLPELPPTDDPKPRLPALGEGPRWKAFTWRYVIWMYFLFVSHVLQLLPIRFTQTPSSCCI